MINKREKQTNKTNSKRRHRKNIHNIILFYKYIMFFIYSTFYTNKSM